jgi:glutathione S-transferase
MIQITTFKWVPPFVQGYVKDLSVRWALEEIGLPYGLKLITREDQSSSEYRKHQPFGQVPVYQEGELSLFESGGILLHIGEKSENLLPADQQARSRAFLGGCRAELFGALHAKLQSYGGGFGKRKLGSRKTSDCRNRSEKSLGLFEYLAHGKRLSGESFFNRRYHDGSDSQKCRGRHFLFRVPELGSVFETL